MTDFYIGLFDLPHCQRFDRCMVSVNRLRKRKSDFVVNDWIMDSGAFTEISTHGEYRDGVAEYAKHIRRWKSCGNLLAAVSQDYMCGEFILEKTGMDVRQHQVLTIERYDALIDCDTGTYIMPVLQGVDPAEYARHVQDYGDRLSHGAWVGVGSVCKRNADPNSIAAVLNAIRGVRPDLRLHGFGIKRTALGLDYVAQSLHSADSMAWCFAAWREKRNVHDVNEALRYARAMETLPRQTDMFWGV